MTYHRDGWQGVGAIAAALPAQRSSPAPTVAVVERMPLLGGMPGPLAPLTVTRLTSAPTPRLGVNPPPINVIGTFTRSVPIETIGGTAFIPTSSGGSNSFGTAGGMLGTSGGGLLGTSGGTRPTVVGGGLPPKRPSSSPGTITTVRPPSYQPPQPDKAAPVVVSSSSTSPTISQIGGGGSAIGPVVEDLPLDEQFAPVFTTPVSSPGLSRNAKIGLAIGGAALLYYLLKKKS